MELKVTKIKAHGKCEIVKKISEESNKTPKSWSYYQGSLRALVDQERIKSLKYLIKKKNLTLTLLLQKKNKMLRYIRRISKELRLRGVEFIIM